MTLTELAHTFENNVLNVIFHLITDNNNYYILTSSENFAHIVGIERAKEFSVIDDYNKFFYDCYNNKYTKQLRDYNYISKAERYLVRIKVENINKLSGCIIKAQKLYHIYDDNGNADTFCLCERFKATKHQYKFLTLVFKRKGECNFYVLASIQVDKDYSYTLANTAFKAENIKDRKLICKGDDYYDKLKNELENDSCEPIPLA